MKKDYSIELQNRINFIKEIIKESKTDGIVLGLSGGKDSALVAAICKKACINVLGVIMPCGVKRNFTEDMDDAKDFAKQFDIETLSVDLTDIKNLAVKTLDQNVALNDNALFNIAPRLRMTVLYAVAASKNYLVAGTDNKSEMHMGYFTKWGDGAYDFNPISDLTVTEVYEFMHYMNLPDKIINKVPSAALYEGQTDEEQMGVTYKTLDSYLQGNAIDEKSKKIIDRTHEITEHKRQLPKFYK